MLYVRWPCLNRMWHMRILFLLALSLVLPGTVRATTLDITYNLAPPEAQVAIDHAAGIWESALVSPVPIKVLVTWAPLGTSTLGITFPNGRRDFAGAPLPQTWYATSLANSIAGAELNLGENDIEIYFSSSFNWYFGTDGGPSNGQYDLVSVALHELGHGLGFVGLSKVVDADGSFGLLQASDFSPLITTFPWPQLDTLPGVFDRYLTHAQNGPLVLMDNPGVALGDAQTSNQVYFNGPLAMAANAGISPRIYAPSTFALGSSCVHLNESTYPVGNPNELMTPFISSGEANHWPGPLCLAMLQDIGWTLAPDVGLLENTGAFAVLAYPNPAHDRISFTFPDRSRSDVIMIIDAQGRTIRTLPFATSVDVRDMSPGTYVLHVSGSAINARFTKE